MTTCTNVPADCPYAKALLAILTHNNPGPSPPILSEQALHQSPNVSISNGSQPPSRQEATVSEALELYFDEISASEQHGKSPMQIKSWRRVKSISIRSFIEVLGDKTMTSITREDARAFYRWQISRIAKDADPKFKRDPSTARRELGNLRKLYREYFAYIGEEQRPNPFRGLTIQDGHYQSRPPFSNSWVRERILKPGVLQGIQREAVLALYALIETGCRPSEIANLAVEDIRLNHTAPHITIQPTRERRLKTRASKRSIPLVGVSLAAMRQAPNGFPRFQDRSHLLSKSLMKAFRTRELFPTDRHAIYSFRHSFEKRMQEAGIDYGLRCLLMGHDTKRPAYGDGGSISYRQRELLKIAHPFPEDLFDY